MAAVGRSEADGAMLGAIGMVARAQVRRRWPVLVAIGLLLGVAGAVVGGGAALARRTATAYDRLERATLVPDVQITMTTSPDLAFRAAAAVPDVEGVWVTRVLVARVEDRPDVTYIGALEGHPVGSDPGAYTPVLVAGRFYDPGAAEAVLDERAASRYGLHVGDQLPLRLLTQSDYNSFDTGFGEPGGPPVSLRITGLVRMAGLGQDQTPLLLSPAAAADLPSVGMLVAIRVRPAPGAVARADAALARAATVAARDGSDPDAAEFPVLDVTHPATDSDPRVTAARRVLVTGVLVFVTAVAVTGFAMGAAAFARHYDRRVAEQRIEAVLGLPPAGRAAARVLAVLPAAALAGLVAAAGPVLGGSLGPIGPLAVCEPHPGYAPNLTAALVTGLATGVATVLLAGWTAARAGRAGGKRRVASGPARGRSAARPRTADGWVLGDGGRPGGRGPGPRWAGPVWLWVGVRFAVGAHPSSLTRRPSLFTAGAAVAVLVAAATVGQGITRLVHEPSRYGWSADLYVNDVRPDIVAALRADPWIASVSESAVSSVQVGVGCAAGASSVAMAGVAMATPSAAPTGPPVLTGIGTPVAPAAQPSGQARPLGPSLVPSPPLPTVAAQPSGTGASDLDVPADPGVRTGPAGSAGATRSAARAVSASDGPAAAVVGCGQLPAYAFTGAPAGWTVLTGRLLAGPAEAVVGTRAARTLGVGVGDTIDVASPSTGRPLRLTVVGIGLGPAISGERLGANVLLDPRTLSVSERTAPLHEAFVQVAHGVSVDRVGAELGARYEVVVRQPPDEVANLGAIGLLPHLLQIVLGVLAAGAFIQAVVSGWRRRAAEVAVLRVLGATPRRLGAVAVTASVVAALAAMLVGVPLGLGVGRLCWWEIATAVGVGTDVAVPATLLLWLPVVAAVLAVALGLLPAAGRRALRVSRRARHSRVPG